MWLLFGDGESEIFSRVGAFMKSFITGPSDLWGQVSQELTELTEDVEEAHELSLRIKDKLHVSEPLGDRFLGDGGGVSQDDAEEEELIDSREVLFCPSWEGRLGNAI